MKLVTLLILCLALIPEIVFAQSFTNSDLERIYGTGGSSSSNESQGNASSESTQESCIVVNFSSYDETSQRSRAGIITTSQERYGNTSFGSGVVTGGGTVTNKIATYVSVTIRNNSEREKRITASDVKAYTIKGNVSTPINEKIEYIGPGQSATITGLKFNPISQIVDVKVSCN